MLASAIAARLPSKELFLCSGLTASAVLDRAAVVRAKVGSSAKSIGVLSKEDLGVAIAVIAMDRAVNDLLLIPHDSDLGLVRELVERAGCDLLLTDLDLPTGALPCPVIRIDCSASSSSHQLKHGDVSTRWILPTSGTTGVPKLVAHTVDSLTRSVRRDTSRGEKLRWGCLYDVTRFAGLQVFLQAILGGSALIFVDRRAALPVQLAQLAEKGCNALSATPTLWRKLLMCPEVQKLQLRQVTLGGEIADGPILRALQRTFPDARVVHIYASTEAGVGFSVTDGLPGFPASYFNVMANGTELRMSPEGTLMIKPPQTHQSYVGSPGALASDDGFIDTGDRVEVRGERVYFRGRANGSINVGGNKVMPEEIEEVLLSHPRVRFAKVGARKSSVIGNLVEAAVVVTSEAATDENLLMELKQHCSRQLAPYKVPAFIRFVKSIEVSSSGKLQRA